MDNSLRSKVTAALKSVFPGSDHDVSLDGNGIVTLRFDDGAGLTLEVPEFGEAFHVYTPVVHVSVNDRMAICSRALSLNLFSIAVPGAWLALDQEDDRFLLCLTLDIATCDSERLTGIFEDILEEAGRLRRQLSADQTADVMAMPDPSMVHIRI